VNLMAVAVAAHVLVVEDDPEILRLMKQVLSRDFEVHTAASGEEALQILRSHRLHAVISDHMLPAMTGIDLLRQAATLQPDAARVLVTASTRMDIAQEAVNVARVKRFLTKPFRTAELISTVGEAIHEVALFQIKSQLIQELKERNTVLSRAVDTLGARDQDLSRKLEQSALRDNVTGVFSHRYFQESLSAERLRSQRTRAVFSLLLIDVDDFRTFNREYGFDEGDLLLRRVAQLLLPAEAAARYAGDRFAVVLSNVARENARVAAAKICSAVERLGRSADSPGPFTVSAGVATYPDDADTEEGLISAAETALRRAKQEGGNRVG
jgi:diguanylate cyclase (GGDEF)-like protein